MFTQACNKVFFYFQSKVSVQKAVLHGQAPHQHCDSSMQYNLQDQRFQKILLSAYRHHLKTSVPFRQQKLKFSVCLKIPVNPHAFQWQPKHLLASSCLHEALCCACQDCIEPVRGRGPGSKFIWRRGYFQLDQLCNIFLASSAGISQGWHRLEKNRQEKVAPADIDFSISTTTRYTIA